MSFYRTYRPQVIDEIDNPAIREHLSSLLTKDRTKLPHAFFLTGPKGTGKTTAARVIAKLFNCTKRTKAGPCGTCEQCVSIAKGTNMDVIEMDAASNRGIDEIRTLRDRINLSPVSAEFTIYIIDEVHMLTTEAFNALLKTLEEPPAHAVFVLATTDAHKVPGTILSRCVHLGFQKAGVTELFNVIARIAKQEKLDIDKEAIDQIAHAADGSFRDAAKLLEQVSFHKGKITKDVVERVLALATTKLNTVFVSALFMRDTPACLNIVAELVSKGIDIRVFITDVLGDLHTLLVSGIQGNAGTLSTHDLQQAIHKLTQAFGETRYSPIPSLPLELAIVEFCTETSKPKAAQVPEALPQAVPAVEPLGLLTLEKLTEHWPDFIAATKPYNHSVAGVLRSSRPKSVEDGIVTIEAFYKFHQEKLADIKTRQVLADVLKKLFGEKVKVDIVVGKK